MLDHFHPLDRRAAYREAGADELHVHQIGTDRAGMYAFCRDEVLPRL